jgi:hypothetical protein
MPTQWIEFAVEDIRKMPTSMCIYALYDGADLVYVGKTINMRHRMEAHRQNRIFTRAKARIIANHFRLDYLERRLIDRLKPPQNKAFI